MWLAIATIMPCNERTKERVCVGMSVAKCKECAKRKYGGTPLQGPTEGGKVPIPITRVIDNIWYLSLFSF
jgi:hypothetical protein